MLYLNVEMRQYMGVMKHPQLCSASFLASSRRRFFPCDLALFSQRWSPTTNVKICLKCPRRRVVAMRLRVDTWNNVSEGLPTAHYALSLQKYAQLQPTVICIRGQDSSPTWWNALYSTVPDRMRNATSFTSTDPVNTFYF